MIIPIQFSVRWRAKPKCTLSRIKPKTLGPTTMSNTVNTKGVKGHPQSSQLSSIRSLSSSWVSYLTSFEYSDTMFHHTDHTECMQICWMASKPTAGCTSSTESSQLSSMLSERSLSSSSISWMSYLTCWRCYNWWVLILQSLRYFIYDSLPLILLSACKFAEWHWNIQQDVHAWFH